jgi:RNA polymerase sigma factor (sigma-70 family)
MVGNTKPALQPGGSGGRPATEGFEAAYTRLWPVAVRLARLMTGSSQLAEEIAQDAFLGIHRNWDRVDNPDGYLRVAVVNGCRDAAQRQARDAARPWERERVALPPEMDDTWSVLAELPPRQRAAIVLRFYEDLPVDEIARLLSCRPGTVKSSIHRGLARLKETIR